MKNCRSRLLRPLATATMCLVLAAPGEAISQASSPIQYILISFDGAHDVQQWARSRELAQNTGARFTYFQSCTFLLLRQNRHYYHGPDQAKGRSNVGFADTRSELTQRLNHLWSAVSEGHEIASHGCGHFDGGKWTKSQWLQEFTQFSDILVHAWKINGIAGEPERWRKHFRDGIKGFRAPYLSAGPGLYAALAETGFDYDASAVSGTVADTDFAQLLKRFALPMIPEGPSQRKILAMDYNFYVRHSKAREKPENGRYYEARALNALRQAFTQQYAGERIPLQLGFHFTLMNGGAYWRALEKFASETCTRTDVRCISYRQYIDEHPHEVGTDS